MSDVDIEEGRFPDEVGRPNNNSNSTNSISNTNSISSNSNRDELDPTRMERSAREEPNASDVNEEAPEANREAETFEFYPAQILERDQQHRSEEEEKAERTEAPGDGMTPVEEINNFSKDAIRGGGGGVADLFHESDGEIKFDSTMNEKDKNSAYSHAPVDFQMKFEDPKSNDGMVEEEHTNEPRIEEVTNGEATENVERKHIAQEESTATVESENEIERNDEYENESENPKVAKERQGSPGPFDEAGEKNESPADLRSRSSTANSIQSRFSQSTESANIRQLDKNFRSFQKFEADNIFVDPSYSRLRTPADRKFDKLALVSTPPGEKYFDNKTPPEWVTPGQLLSGQSSPRSGETRTKNSSSLSLSDPLEKSRSRSRSRSRTPTFGKTKVATTRTQRLREQKTWAKSDLSSQQMKRALKRIELHNSSSAPPNLDVAKRDSESSESKSLKSKAFNAPDKDKRGKRGTTSFIKEEAVVVLGGPPREVDRLLKGFINKEVLPSRLFVMARNSEWSELDRTLRTLDRNDDEVHFFDEETGLTLLMLSATDNRISTMDKLLDFSVCINARAKDGRTALHFATMYGKDDCTRWLIKRKADPNIIGGPNDQLPLHMACYRTYHGASLMVQALLRVTKEGRLTSDKNGFIPLHIAASSRNVATCKELLSQQAPDQLAFPMPNFGSVLHYVCRMKEIDVAAVLLDHRPDVDSQSNDGQTPLHVSAFENNFPLVKLLHMHGAQLNVMDKHDRTPIHIATERGHVKIIEYLAEKNADIMGRTKDGDTLVHLAASSGHPDVALVFLKKGLPLHMPNKSGATCLHAAAKSGHSGVIRALISKGAKVDGVTKDKQTALHVAAKCSNAEAVQALIGHGASVNAKGGDKQETPLHIASGNNDSEQCVEILLKSGAEVNATQENLETPLHVAASSENVKVMEILLEYGADMTLLSKNGENPLHLAVRSCYVDSVKFLLDNFSGGALSDYVNQSNEEGETSLHYASELARCQAHYDNEDVDIVKLLISNGGDVNLRTKTTSETPIHYCAKAGNHEIARAMFQYLGQSVTSSAINNLCSKGNSGLLVACKEGHLETVKVFLSHNARVDVFEEQGKAPLHLAAEFGHYEIVEELLKHKAYAGAKTKLGHTPLHFAAQNGHARLAILLADKHKSSMEAVTLDRQTPLHLASEKGQKAVVGGLLRMKVNAEARNNKGQTALHLAAENDHSDVVKMLLRFKPDLVISANSDGMTCAHIAASKGRTAVVEELMRFNKEAVLTAKNKTNQSTPLQLAVIGGHVDVVQSLMEAGASAVEENSDGMSALLLAAQHGHLQILDILREKVPLDIVSQKTGYTALHVASKHGQQEFVRELLNHVSHELLTKEPHLDLIQVILDLNSDHGFTALHLAAENGHERLVRFLLNSTKIMSDAKSSVQGVTALHLAASSGHADVASLLLSKLSVLISVRDRKGRLPLHLAAYNGRLNMVTLLIGQGTDVDADDQKGWTPLHYASKAGHLDVVQLLVASGCNSKFVTKDGKPAASLAASAGHTHVLSYLMQQDLDTRHFLEDNKFAFDLMELGKLNDQQPIAEFVLASRVPAETSAKLSKIFRQLALKEKERANDLEEAAEYCDKLALELTAIACNIINARTLLNAIEEKEMTFLDLLIDCEQKEVIAYPTIQMYLSEVWTGYLSEWSSWRMLLLLLCMLLCPLFWIIISLPLKTRISKIPVVKFMTHLVSHIYIIVLFIVCTTYPSFNLWDAPYRAPSWSEWLLLVWLSGLVVEQLTNNENPSGLGWLRLFLLGTSTLATIFGIAAYAIGDEDSESVYMYIRNQCLALSMLLSFVLLMEFLSFHHLFGPWAIIIRELMKDLLRFVVVLAIFMLGFSFQISAIYMPVYRTTNDTSPGPCEMTTQTPGEITTLLSPRLTFEMLFFALFGLIDMGNLPCLSNQPWWSIYLLKSIIGIYMLITFVMLVNLLIAMMSDTYADIQAQSDVEWKFGRAKLFQNMNKTSSAPAPLILITKLITYITILHRFRAAGCVYNTQPFVNEIEGLDSDMTTSSSTVTITPEDESKSYKFCPCLKMKTEEKSKKSVPVSKPQQNRLEEVINWKLVSEKYLSVIKKHPVDEED